MTRFPLLLALLAVPFAACSKDATPAAPDVAAPVPADSLLGPDADCNLSTPLKPGIPGSPGHLIQSDRNPNGDSELSALMRRFVDDLRNARVFCEAGQPVPAMFATHRKMRCAWPTRAEDRNARFDAMAQSYLVAVRTFDGAPTKGNYNGVVNGCIACHSSSCGGPLDFIDGMKWP